MTIASVTLKPRRARPFFGRHPWVFEGAIAKTDHGLEPGQLVRVVSHEKKFIAYGLYNANSNIRVRLYSWDANRPIDESLVVERIERAVQFRHQNLGLQDRRGACRLVFSESDGLSGLVVDRYADVAVVQLTSLAMARFESAIVASLERILGPRGICRRTERGVAELEGLETQDAVLLGEVPDQPIEIAENGLRFLVDPRKGQKTGTYLDQRENRLALCRYTRGRSMLDLFCHTGGFAITAARLGEAGPVMGIDTSASALALAEANAQLNDVQIELCAEKAIPAMQRLATEGRRFGVIVCDPPKFARTSGGLDRAIHGLRAREPISDRSPRAGRNPAHLQLQWPRFARAFLGNARRCLPADRPRVASAGTTGPGSRSSYFALLPGVRIPKMLSDSLCVNQQRRPQKGDRHFTSLIIPPDSVAGCSMRRLLL